MGIVQYFKKMKKRELDYLITEEIKSFLKEAEDTVLGKETPIGLSKIKKDTAKAVGGGGLKDKDKQDDVVSGKKVSIPVGNLRPAQTEIIKDKAFGMAVNFLTKGGYDNADLNAIISKDTNHNIMDGHHRWAATSLIDPKAKVQATQIDLPGGPLVTALNLFTKGIVGKDKGNEGKGNVADFTGVNMEVVIDNALEKGTPGEFGVSGEAVKAALGKMPGAGGDAQKGKAIMMKNADSLPKKKMPGAPARVEMPVINDEQVEKVKNMLAKGELDITEPYSPEVEDAISVSTEKETEEVAETKRWKKLAGIS